MKTKLILSLGLVAALVYGCTTTQQTTSFNTLWTLESSTKSIYDGYLALVVQGRLATNEVPQISKLFNDFQASMLLAESLVQYNTNAIAPTNLVIESQQLINLIQTINLKTK